MRKESSCRGFTLIELIISLSITTILMTATVSSVLLAGKAVPDPNDAASGSITAAQVTDRIAGELETAILVLEQTPTALTFLVPPRNADTTPEKIRYSWAGTSGSPLMRQYEGGTPIAVIDKVDQFSLTPGIATSTESYPGLCTEDTTESLVIDYSSATGLLSKSVSPSNWSGQYFASNTWPAGVYGWRPTHVRFQAQQSGATATTNVQLRPASSTLAPMTVYEQYSLPGSGLSASFAWQDFYFSSIPRLTTSTGICLVLQGTLGLPNSLNIEANTGANYLQGTLSGATWALDSTHSLQSQIYGKLTRSTTTQTATSRYLTSLGISLRAGRSGNPAVQTTALCLSHPEMLGAYWELKFNSDPTHLDVNGDDLNDWNVHGGGTFNVATLVNGTWQASGTGLDTQPGDNFSRLTIVDLRFRATSSGSVAGFSINAARSGNNCAPVLAQIAMQADGTQTLTVMRKLSDAVTDTLVSIPNLSSQAVDLHLIIDPAYGSVGIAVNTVQYGTFAYNVFTSSDSSQSASLSSSGTAEFSYVRVRERLP